MIQKEPETTIFYMVVDFQGLVISPVRQEFGGSMMSHENRISLDSGVYISQTSTSNCIIC